MPCLGCGAQIGGGLVMLFLLLGSGSPMGTILVFFFWDSVLGEIVLCLAGMAHRLVSFSFLSLIAPLVI